MTRAARQWTIRIDAGEEDALFAALQEISLPMLRDRPGFNGLLLLRNREDSQEVSYLTLWKDAAAMEEGIQSPEWQEALRRFEDRDFQLTEPRIAHYEVIAEEWPS